MAPQPQKAVPASTLLGKRQQSFQRPTTTTTASCCQEQLDGVLDENHAPPPPASNEQPAPTPKVRRRNGERTVDHKLDGSEQQLLTRTAEGEEDTTTTMTSSVVGKDCDASGSFPLILLRQLLRDVLLDDNFLNSFVPSLHHHDDMSSSEDPSKILKVLAQMFRKHNIRTSMIVSPSPALSVYRDSFPRPPDTAPDSHPKLSTNSEEPSSSFSFPTFWSILLGLHPHQEILDRLYSATNFQALWCAHCTLQFLLRNGHFCFGAAYDDSNLTKWKHRLHHSANHCREALERHVSSMAFDDDTSATTTTNNSHYVSTSSDATHWKSWLQEGDWTQIQRDYFQNVYRRVCAQNSTLSNVCWYQWNQYHPQLEGQVVRLQRIEYCPSCNPKYERYKLYPDDLTSATGNVVNNLNTTLLPCWPYLLVWGVDDTARNMVDYFWSRLWTHQHYRSTSTLRDGLSPQLHKFFVSSLLPDSESESKTFSHISVTSRFAPTYPLSMYLHGPSGTGKSSLVRQFARAFQSTLEHFVHPLARVDTVKQLLNKPLSDLALDLELRRNNNDMSLSSILISRRDGGLAHGHATTEGSGIVVLALEELAPPCDMMSSSRDPDVTSDDPNQRDSVQLLCERLSGQTGPYAAYSHVRVNGGMRRGVSGDTSLVTIFTSNYPLQAESLKRLQDLKMLENLLCIDMTALDLKDRRIFAENYLHRHVEYLWTRRHGSGGIDVLDPSGGDGVPTDTDLCPLGCEVRIDLTLMQLGSGDTRPLVRRLRMLAYYIHQLRIDSQDSRSSPATSCPLHLRVVQRDDEWIINSDDRTWTLRMGPMDILSLVGMPSAFDVRTTLVQESLRKSSFLWCNEVSAALDFWWMGSLAPLVMLSRNGAAIPCLLEAFGGIRGVHVIEKVNVRRYKMMRSLYDPASTPNLRDDIKRLGKGVFVVIELICPDVKSQLCIREVIEDTPSVAAFSSDRSALYKEGLFFLVHLMGNCITPELKSRASWIY